MPDLGGTYYVVRVWAERLESGSFVARVTAIEAQYCRYTPLEIELGNKEFSEAQDAVTYGRKQATEKLERRNPRAVIRFSER